jgi:hypothetical protein
MPYANNPLTPEHDQHLANVISSANGTNQILQDCADCGLPLDELQAQNNSDLNIAKALRAKFFPESH